MPGDPVTGHSDLICDFSLKTTRNDKLRILYINNNGGGFADFVNVDDGTTVSSFFNQRVRGHAEEYLIRVNRQPVSAGQVLQDGDRVSITPVNIEGACG